MKSRLSVFCAGLLSLVAVVAWAQAVDEVNPSTARLIARADSLMLHYKFEQALVVLKSGDSLDSDILLRVGQCHFRLGASAAAMRPYERILQVDSFNTIALNQLGQLYSRGGDNDKALRCFIKLLKLDSTNSYYYKQAGLLATRNEDKLAAAGWFKRALDLNPADMEASMALGTILMQFERYRAVDSIGRQALTFDPDFKPMLLLMAKSAFEQKQYQTVISSINKLLEKSDTTAVYARLLGLSYFHCQAYDKLITCLYFLLNNNYDYEWVYYYMGIAERKRGDVPASIRWLNLAVKKSVSENVNTYYTELAGSHEIAGNYTEAIRAYKAAYAYSKEGILLYHLARTYDMYYKDKATALLYYKRYLASDDTLHVARQYVLKRIQDEGQL